MLNQAGKRGILRTSGARKSIAAGAGCLLLATNFSFAAPCEESYSGLSYGAFPTAYASCRTDLDYYPQIISQIDSFVVTVGSAGEAELVPTPLNTVEIINLASPSLTLGSCPNPYAVVPPLEADIQLAFQPNQVYCLTLYDGYDGAITLQATTGADDRASFTDVSANIFRNPYMEVRGSAITIPDDDSTPQTEDNTDFGSLDVVAGSLENEFQIINFGSEVLNLTGTTVVQIAGDTDDFNLTALPAATLAPYYGDGVVTTYSITFNPTASGLRVATVSIANDDDDRNPYNFSIQGTGTVASPETAVHPVPALSPWSIGILGALFSLLVGRIRRGR